METDLNNLLDYKSEIDKVTVDIRTKLDKKKQNESFLKDSLNQKEQELEKREFQLRKLAISSEE